MTDSSTAVLVFYLFFYAVYYGAQIIGAIIIVKTVKRNNRRRREAQNYNARSNANVSALPHYSPANRSVNSSSSESNSTRNVAQPVSQSQANAKTSFGPVNYFANARHNQSDKWFQFEYIKENGVWLTYILRMPSLNGRDGNAHITHRYSGGGKYWICYDPQPRNLKDAQIISRVWADRELEYIATGIPFERQTW